MHNRYMMLPINVIVAILAGGAVLFNLANVPAFSGLLSGFALCMLLSPYLTTFSAADEEPHIEDTPVDPNKLVM